MFFARRTYRTGVIMALAMGTYLAATVSSHALGANRTCQPPQVKSLTARLYGDGQVWRAQFRVTIDSGGLPGSYVLHARDTLGSGEFQAGTTSFSDGTDPPYFSSGLEEDIYVELKTACGATSRTFVLLPPRGIVGSLPDRCNDYVIIDSRGSGQRRGQLSKPGQAFVAAFRNLHQGAKIQVWPNLYRAVGVGSFPGAFLRLPASYHHSVEEGKARLRAMLNSLLKTCAGTKVLLVGYSQGAQVTGDVYQERVWPNVRGMVLFGDPSFNAQDPNDWGPYSSHKNGILRARPLYQLHDGSVIKSFCYAHDPICQGLGEWRYFFSWHNAYARYVFPEYAARYMTNYAG